MENDILHTVITSIFDTPLTPLQRGIQIGEISRGLNSPLKRG